MHTRIQLLNNAPSLDVYSRKNCGYVECMHSFLFRFEDIPTNVPALYSLPSSCCAFFPCSLSRSLPFLIHKPIEIPNYLHKIVYLPPPFFYTYKKHRFSNKIELFFPTKSSISSRVTLTMLRTVALSCYAHQRQSRKRGIVYRSYRDRTLTINQPRV